MIINRAQAARAAYLSELIYEPVAAIRQSLPIQFEFINKDDTQVGLFWCDNGTYVVFRGTEASKWVWADIFSNMKIGPTHWAAGGKAHSGYAEAVLDVADDVLGALQNYPRPWIVTGHSLGGSLATLMASYMKLANSRPNATYTFGAPKCLDYEGAYTVPALFYRIVYKNDIAPTFPADWTGYRHPLERTRWHLRGDGFLRHQLYQWSHTLRPPFNGVSWSQAKKDHMIGNYRAKLWQPGMHPGPEAF